MVDDSASFTDYVVRLLEERGHAAIGESDPVRARDRVRAERWGLVLVDLGMPEVSGFDLLAALRASQPGTPCVVVTADRDAASAVRALKLGAVDYVCKPAGPDSIVAAVEGALGPPPPGGPLAAVSCPEAFAGFVTRSPALGDVFQRAERLAPTDLPVLVTGPSGAGKEVLARAVHALSRTPAGPFVGVNVAAIPPPLFAGQLFGHRQGAFSGANRAMPGYAEAAAGGTLFLDEVGELDPFVQAQLLRVLQEREYYVLGATTPTRLRARVVAATNRDLAFEVTQGRFREDLFHRLRGGLLRVPGLAERPEDVPPVAEHFARVYGEELRGRPARVAPDVLAWLRARAWPGNVRELQNVLREAVLSAEGGVIGLLDLPLEYRCAGPARAAPPPSLSALEREHILRVLEEMGGNVTRSARLLGISRVTLHRKLRRLREDARG